MSLSTRLTAYETPSPDVYNKYKGSPAAGAGVPSGSDSATPPTHPRVGALRMAVNPSAQRVAQGVGYSLLVIMVAAPLYDPS